MIEFPTLYDKITDRLEKIRPEKYASTRNFIDGNVTYLSPYISRGVISTNQVKAEVLKKSTVKKVISLYRNWHGVNTGKGFGKVKGMIY